MSVSSISVIIPVYNEERTIASIIEIVRTWGKAKEIVVVNDGSTDRTLRVLAQFRKKITVISYTTNRGKGYALARGVTLSSGEILVFLDGDLVGLTHKALDSMLSPVMKGRADMVLGITRLWRLRIYDQAHVITGQRVLFRKHIISSLGKMKRVGYGVELLLQDIYRNKRVVSVRLPYVYFVDKFEKQNLPDAMRSYVKQARELGVQLIRQQTGEMTPRTKHIFRLLQKYLKSALDAFQ